MDPSSLQRESSVLAPGPVDELRLAGYASFGSASYRYMPTFVQSYRLNNSLAAAIFFETLLCDAESFRVS